jgi:flavin-dependent dehydrogenase
MTHSPGTYDAIVVGGEPDGLVSAVHLAEATLADARSARRSPRRALSRLQR